jgi:bifunctional DNA-binding transcriptional regulator/antitoxin component of YhaV-PrlF toxin-antitoxin module
MRFLGDAIVNGRGQITIPAALRRHWALKAGERIRLCLVDAGYVLMIRHNRRSILKSRNDLMPLSAGRPVAQKDIDNAVAEAMTAQELRVRSGDSP